MNAGFLKSKGRVSFWLALSAIVLSSCAGINSECLPFGPGDPGGYCAQTAEDAEFWRKQVWQETYGAQ